MWIMIAMTAIPALAVLFWPRKEYREFVRIVLLDAPIEKVWDVISCVPKADGLPRLGYRYEATDEPDLFRGHPTQENADVNLLRHFPMAQPYLEVTRLEASYSPVLKRTTPFPVGEDTLDVMQLTPAEGGGTRLFSYTRLRGNLFVNLHFRWIGLPRYLRRIRSEVAGHEPARPILTSGWIWKIAATALALFVAIQQFGWIEGLVISGIIFLHEFGHALGYRAVGERVLGVHLVPFFGGITIGTMPKTAMRSAIVALSGTSFSLLLAFLLTAGFLLSGATAIFWSEDGVFAPNAAGGVVISIAGMLTLNILQLLPVRFMDGGRTLEAAISGLSSRARRLTLATAGLSIAAVAHICGLTVFAVMALLFVGGGVLFDALAKNNALPSFKPATLTSGLAIAGLYLGHIALYLVLMLWVGMMFFRGPGDTGSDQAEVIHQSPHNDPQIVLFEE